MHSLRETKNEVVELKPAWACPELGLVCHRAELRIEYDSVFSTEKPTSPSKIETRRELILYWTDYLGVERGHIFSTPEDVQRASKGLAEHIRTKILTNSPMEANEKLNVTPNDYLADALF